MKTKSFARHILFLLSWFVFSTCSQKTNNTVFYVSTGGKDTNPGTKQQPFATLQKAKSAVNGQLGKTKTGINKNYVVYIEPGIYKLDSTIRFTTNDSGTDSLNRITYKATEAGKVYFTGGVSLKTNVLKKAKNSGLKEAFQPHLQDSIYCIHLKKAGISNLGEMKQHGFSIAIKPAALELFINDLPLYPARWPNDSLVPILEVTDPGSAPRHGDTTNRGGTFTYNFKRAVSWEYTNNAWLYGFFAYGYADDNLKLNKIDTLKQQISVVQPHLYGIKSSLGDHWAAEHRKFCVYNIPEEIDRPGEYYFDMQKGEIYFYPPTNNEIKKIQASVLETPMISFINASHITFEGITFECSRGMGIYIEQGQDVEIKNCTFRNLGTVAVSFGMGVAGEAIPAHNFTGKPTPEVIGNLKAHLYDNTIWNRMAGKNHTITDSKIYQTGTGGIILSGGHRLSLTNGNNTIKNCEIYDYNRLNKAYCPAVSIDGVGNNVINCSIHDAPNQGIAIFGNEHRINKCIFERICTEANDMGAIYMGRNPTERGNVIQNCYFNEIGLSHHQSVAAIYFDDMACGNLVKGNVFRKAGKGYFSAVFVNNGSDIKVSKNLFIDTKSAYNIEAGFAVDKKERFKKMMAPGGIYYERLLAVKFDQEPWKSKYPHLLKLFDENAAIPKRNPFINNVVIRSKVFESRTNIKPENFVKNTIHLTDTTENKEQKIQEIKQWLKQTDVNKVLKHAQTNFMKLYKQ